MTTNVLDLRNGIATSDSRWSTDSGNFFFYVDNTGFDKIVSKGPFAFVFAGDSGLIQEWKDWASNLPDNSEVWPDEDRFGKSVAVTVTNMKTGHVLFERKQDFSTHEAKFAGTGSIHAYACWQRNFDAIRAVRSATYMDMCSGGDVKYLNFDGATNVENCTRIDRLTEILFETGRFMRTDGHPQSYPIKDYSSVDPELSKALSDVVSGKQSLIAPCDAMYSPWTSDEKRMFSRAISKVVQELK